MMKRVLLCSLALGIALSADAQQTPGGKVYRGMTLKEKENVKVAEAPKGGAPVVSPNAARKKAKVPSTQAVTFQVIGSSSNAYGTAFGAKTALFAHPVINSVSMVYRSAPAVTSDVSSGCLRYGFSTDGGASWTTNAGPLYTSNGTNAAPLANARYPQGVIYNPAGNTDPNNAFVSHFSPTLAGFGPGANSAWGGHAHGSMPLNGTGTATATEDIDANNGFLIPDGGALNLNSNSFWISNGYFDFTSGDYADTMLLGAGTWNAGDYTYSYNKVYAPVDIDLDGSKLLVGTSVAWGSSGTGYMALVGHESFAQVPDINYYPVIYKTTDDGLTWNKVAALDMNSFDSIFQYGVPYSNAFEFDMGVDANNNLHLVTAVCPQASAGFSVSTGPGNWAIFDIYTTDGGTTWATQLLGTPMTFRGEFLDLAGAVALQEDSRPQVTRSLDGTKMFFTWFDTDTLTFGTTENVFPDAHCVGYDLTSGLWTTDINLTTGTDADGACLFGSVAPIALDGASGCYKIPVAVVEVTNGGVDAQIDHKYIDGLEICSSAFTEAGTPVAVNNLFVTGVNELSGTTSFSFGQNYPNPFNGSTQFVLNLNKSSNVTVEVHNVVGKLVKTIDYSNMSAGSNMVVIDCNDLASGLYTYTVRVGNDRATRTMIVK